jgi:hypothetical protein
MTLGDVEIDSGLLEVMVAQQELNGAQISAVLQQVGGEAVP